MPDNKKTLSNQNWSSVQAYTLAVVCLLLGVAVGWLFRGSQSPSASAPVQTANAAAPAGMAAGPNMQPTPEQMKKMADTQAAPLLGRLQADPNNAGLLANIGNVYYDAHVFPTAIEYYQRALKVEPANTDVLTDIGTAYWYTGNADAAIAQFQKSLSYEPNKANTLFNLGVVQWQGKMDSAAAIATWQKLLDTNPNYEGKDKVLQLIAQAQKHSAIKPGTQAKSLAN